MKLQVALDTQNLNEAINLLEQIQDYIDIVEIGTPFIIREGINPVTEIKNRFPKLEVLADLKIMDAGSYEAAIAYNAGADIATVMAVTNQETIVQAINEAHKHGKKLMVDMMNCSDLKKDALLLESLGADYLCVHTAFDLQANHDPVADLTILTKTLTKSKAAVAGGVGLKTIKLVCQQNPEIVICGGSICNAENPKEMAKTLYEYVKGIR